MHIAEGCSLRAGFNYRCGCSCRRCCLRIKENSSESFHVGRASRGSVFCCEPHPRANRFSSAHLILNGLLGVVLGWAAFPVIFVALLLQAVLFQFGGFTVLGVNTATMGLGALAALRDLFMP